MAERTCTIDGCKSKHYARGWCRRHYDRWLTKGDPMWEWPSTYERFWRHVGVPSPRPGSCWWWLGSHDAKGYGEFWGDGTYVKAHRWSYEHYAGPIPDGLQIDHLCRNPPCVNPLHLEPVTAAENMRRSLAGKVNNANAAKTHCNHGHEFTEGNTILRPSGGRACRECSRRRTREWRKRKKMTEGAQP